MTAAPWLGVAALVIGSALVFCVFDALPFQDLPAHAGLIALRHRLANSAYERRFFVFAPHLGPYSLFRFFGEMLVVPLGPVGAIRTIALLPIVATPLALVHARRRLHRDRTATAAFYGISLGFGFMTLLGFASYLFGVAVMLFTLTRWLELLFSVDQRDPRAWRRELAVVALAPFVFIAHGDAFVLFVAIAGVSAVAGGNRVHRFLRLRALLPALALAGWVSWRERASTVPAGSVPWPHEAFALHFQGAWDKLSLLVTPTLFTRTGLDVAVGIFLWGVLGGAAVVTARSLRAPRQASVTLDEQASCCAAQALLASLTALGAVFLLLPHSIGWFGFVDGRLVPVLLLLAIMAVQRPALGRTHRIIFDRGAPIAASVIVATALVASHLFQAEAAGWREVLTHVPPDARLLNLPIEPNSDIFTAHPFIHYDKLVLADRAAVVSDLWFHQGSAVYPTAENPALRLPTTYSESDLRIVDWPSYRLEDWDYVLIRTRPTSPQPPVPNVLAPVAHRGGWWLFRSEEAANRPPDRL